MEKLAVFLDEIGNQIAPVVGASLGTSLRRSHVCWLAWSGSGIWAAGSGKKSSGGSNKGKFHGLNEFV